MSKWKTVGNESNTTHDFELNKLIEGVLIEKKENVGANNSRLYVIEVGDTLVSVWGSFVLDRKMQSVKVGNEVKIEYLGKKISDKTKRPYKDFAVQYAEIEVSSKMEDLDLSNLPY